MDRLFWAVADDYSQLKNALAIYNDPADLLAHYDDSLLAKKAVMS